MLFSTKSTLRLQTYFVLLYFRNDRFVKRTVFTLNILFDVKTTVKLFDFAKRSNQPLIALIQMEKINKF